MTRKRIPLALTLATALLTTAPVASAAALGELGALSAIGAPFRAEIRLVGGDGSSLAECFRVVTPPGASADLPWLQAGQIRIVGSGANTRLVVSSRTPMNEPIVMLAIENSCESRLRREYTLLLPYPGTAPVEAAAARPASPQRATRTPAPTRPPVRATAPARTTAAAPARPPRSEAAAAPRRARPEAAARAASSDRLEVDKTASPSGVSPAAAAPSAAVADALLTRERELAAAIDRSIIAEMELLARIREMEEIQLRLEARIRALDADAAARRSAPVADRAPVAVAPTTAPPATRPASVSDDRYLLGAMVLAALLLTLLLLRHRRVDAPPEGREPVVSTSRPTITPAPAEVPAPKAAAAITAEPASSAEPAAISAKPADADAASLSFAWEPPAAMASDVSPAVGGDSELAMNEEHKSAVELADIMMSFGRLHGAAETLSEFIRGNPKQAVTPWLKLLEVYRAAGLREEFDAIARELNKTFNVNAVTWLNYDSLRASRTSLEDLPHIIETLQKDWRTTSCQHYLQLLLRDNRDGTRVGFPFYVIDEILLLAGILEDELGPCQPQLGN